MPRSSPPGLSGHHIVLSANKPWNGQVMDTTFWREVDAAMDRREPELISLRRSLHAAPEASNEETETTAFVAATMREMGLKPHVLAGAVGVVADIDLGAPGDSLIALRCELDCVQVDDDKTVSYASKREGLCHACGHDAHTTIVIGCAAAITERLEELRRLKFQHNIRLLFQPAEETSTGSKSMIQQGVIEHVRSIVAVHVDPFVDAGSIGIRKGPITSACQAFKITIDGRSGHSARPYEAIDPIPAATNLVSLFYQLVPRSMDGRYPLALTVASLQAGHSFNAIPDHATITGTLRTARPEDARLTTERMKSIIRGIEASTGCTIGMEFIHDAPATNNDGHIIDVMAQAASDVVGEDHVKWLEVPSIGAEDFACYQEVIPGAIVRLGSARAGDTVHQPLHSSLFDIDESALAIGARLLTRTVLNLAAEDVRD